MQPNESYQIFYYDYSSFNIFVTFPWAAQHTEYPKRIGIERTYNSSHIFGEKSLNRDRQWVPVRWNAVVVCHRTV